MKQCHGTCHKYAALINANLGYYTMGFKRCTVCQVYIKCEGKICPCCNARLRERPRAKQYRERYREITGAIKFTKL